MLRRLLLVVSCAATLAGCAASAAEPSETGDAIVGGAETSEATATGYLGLRFAESNLLTSFCTATLIAADVALTAAHCLDAYEADRARGKPLGIYVFGVGKVAARRTVAIASVQRHPEWLVRGQKQYANDVGYVVLAAPVPGAKTFTVRREPHVAGCDYLALGYGIAKSGYLGGPLYAGDADVRKQVSVCLDGPLTRGFLRVTSAEGATCTGDSGGPLRRAGATEIVGVLSHGLEDEACAAGKQSFYVPLVGQLDFVDEALAATRVPPPR